MRVRVLGGLSVDGVAERDLGSRKGRTLLKVLAVARGAPVAVDTIADVLWGDEPPARPAEHVGVLVSRLRAVLGADRLRRTDAGYLLVADWLDVEEVAALASTAVEALADGRVGAARIAADAALDLVRGPLLPDEEGGWVEPARAAADATVRRARAVAIEAAAAAGDHDAAAALADAALAHDPYDEVVLRSLMHAHVRAGRPASALAAYARARERLAEDLGVSPTAATEAAHAAALVAADSSSGATGPRAAAAAAQRHLPGRDTELARLDEALAAAAGGETVVVSVEGEAGIGKSTLVDHWASGTAAAVVLRGRCDELGRDLPLQPVADALVEHLRAVGADQARAIVGPDGDTLAPLLGPVAGTGATVVADAESGRARLFAALLGALQRAAAAGTLVVIVEDIHLAGPSTRAWLAFARHRSPRTLFVVTSRTTIGLDDAVAVRLGPLTVDDLGTLVPEGRAGELHARSGGHPLLLAALVAAGDDDDEAVPASVRDAVVRWADDLGPEVAATIRAAAVLGVACDLDLVAQVTGTPVVQVLEHLEAAAAVGLVVERGPSFVFRNDLVREGLAASIGATRRALVHRQAARALGSRPSVDALAVAVHAREGGDVDLAAASFVEAAQAASARFDVATAEHHLDAAIALAPTAAAYAARARVRMSRSALDAAADDAAQAVSRGGPASLEVAGWVAYYRRRYREALAYADRAADAEDPAVRVSALALSGRVRHAAGELPGAVERLTTTDEAPPEVRGVADVWLAQARNHEGRPDDALQTLDRVLVDPDRLAHPWAPLHLRFNRAVALGQLGHAADALRAVDELDAAVARTGQVGDRFVAVAANTRGWLLRWCGRGSEADEENQHALEVSEGAFAEGFYVAMLDLADGCLLRGDAAGAAAWADRLASLDTWDGTMAWHQRHRLGLVRARLAMSAGDRDRAALLASDVRADAAARGARRYELLAGALLGLADDAVPDADLDRVVEGIGRCAVIDGWAPVAALAAARRVDAWRGAAEGMVAAVLARSGELGDDVRRLVSEVAPS